MSSTRPLRELAWSWGVQTTFRDTTGRRRSASVDSLLAVLAALGEPVGAPEHAAEALARRRAERAERLLEPVMLAWDGRGDGIAVRLPARAPARIHVRLDLEGGEERSWAVRTEDVRTAERAATLCLDGELPFGRHVLTVAAGRRAGVASVLAAPRRATAGRGLRDWGVFVPLHALVTDDGWGIGDLGGLARLSDGVRELGGGLVATLPLLAAFPGEPSPYRPVSRLFWNEVYVDVTSAPGFGRAPGVRRLVRSAGFASELEAVRSSTLVDHGRTLALKRRVLERLAASLEPEEDGSLRRWLRAHPDAEAYARFRAAGERFGQDWRRWQARTGTGLPTPARLDAGSLAYHRFAQWVAEEQVTELGRRAAASGPGLYLDMPLGVHPDGFDAWRNPSAFASGVSVGAPPDDFFPGGQDWGFPPLHPDRIREDGYAYPMACLRHVFRHAGVARIDHAIGLHRQFWVPHGAPASDGVFVRYPSEEWYAAISLEAHRTGTVVVGEDLGTVPAEVRRGLDRHRLLRSYVLELETIPERTPPVPEPPASSLASLNTHDLPTFASYWRGVDVRERVEAGFVQDERAEERRRARMRSDLLRVLVGGSFLRASDAGDERAVLAAALAWLAASDARLVVVNLEDLWGELAPQNVPGTSRPENWTRRAARSLDDLWRSPEILAVLRRVDDERRAALVGRGDAA